MMFHKSNISLQCDKKNRGIRRKQLIFLGKENGKKKSERYPKGNALSEQLRLSRAKLNQGRKNVQKNDFLPDIFSSQLIHQQFLTESIALHKDNILLNSSLEGYGHHHNCNHYNFIHNQLRNFFDDFIPFSRYRELNFSWHYRNIEKIAQIQRIKMRNKN